MARRLAPFRRYYTSNRSMDDHGVAPSSLVVFDAELAVGHFLREPSKEMLRTGLVVPM